MTLVRTDFLFNKGVTVCLNEEWNAPAAVTKPIISSTSGYPKRHFVALSYCMGLG
jgi:hypothetical protein